MMGAPGEEEKKQENNKKIDEGIMTDNFPKLMSDFTYWEKLENIKQNKC